MTADTVWTVGGTLLAMSRPSQVLLIGVVYAAGVAVARAAGDVDPVAVLIGLIALVLVAASVHYANEFADAETDAITRRTPFSGGSGALARSGLARNVALVAAAVSGGAGLAVGGLGLAAGTLPAVGFSLLVIGAVGGWAYSLPPAAALNRHGLGEIANAVLGGLLLPAFGYAVAAGSLPAWVIAAFVPFALVDFSSVMATAWPDRAADVRVGKRTLVTRSSPRSLRRAQMASLALAGILSVAYVERIVPLTIGVASLVVAPLAVTAEARFTRVESPLWSVATMVALIAVLLIGWALVPPGSWMASART